MSFRQLNRELQEIQETITAACRRRFGRSRSPRRQRLHELCVGLDLERLLSTPMQRGRLVALDTETTGFQAYAGDEIVEIALIEYVGLRPTGRELCSRIRPGIAIPPSSTAIHGIRDDDVADAPTIDEKIEEIVDFIGHSVLIGHHVAFDLRFLNRVTQRALDCRLPQPAVDTMVLFLAMTGRLDRYSLDAVADACGISIEHRHSARGDAIACGAICSHVARALLPADASLSDLVTISEPTPDYGPEYLDQLQRRITGTGRRPKD